MIMVVAAVITVCLWVGFCIMATRHRTRTISLFRVIKTRENVIKNEKKHVYVVSCNNWLFSRDISYSKHL
jgi:uncharacterized membrane protein